jgi:hypothetical protein
VLLRAPGSDLASLRDHDAAPPGPRATARLQPQGVASSHGCPQVSYHCSALDIIVARPTFVDAGNEPPPITRGAASRSWRRASSLRAFFCSNLNTTPSSAPSSFLPQPPVRHRIAAASLCVAESLCRLLPCPATLHPQPSHGPPSPRSARAQRPQASLHSKCPRPPASIVAVCHALSRCVSISIDNLRDRCSNSLAGSKSLLHLHNTAAQYRDRPRTRVLVQPFRQTALQRRLVHQQASPCLRPNLRIANRFHESAWTGQDLNCTAASPWV